MAHHLQCKLPNEMAWTTIATSNARDDDEARTLMADRRNRYQRMNVLDRLTQFRIVTDMELIRERMIELGAEVPALVALALFGANLFIWGALLSGSI